MGGHDSTADTPCATESRVVNKQVSGKAEIDRINHETSHEVGKVDPWVSIEIARRRITGTLPPTPLVSGRPIPGTPVRTFFKCDQMRRTGAYKERGALNALLSLSPEEAKRGVIAASAGNHAQALAYHGGKLGVPVTVVMPINAPLIKVQNCRGFGANVIQAGKDFAAAKDAATELAASKGLMYVNGYDHPFIIAGAGTCGLEIMDQFPDVEAIVVPVGGGGLLAGIALAVKRLNPRIRVIGVESERCPDVTNALKHGKPIYTPVGAGGTIADGLAVNVVGSNTFELIQQYVDEVITVSENYIARAILHMLEIEKMLVEGGGATGVAALLSGLLDKDLAGKKVVTVVTGGNIDITLLGRIINQGMYSSGRLHMFDVAISNRIGGLAHFVSCLAKTGASVKKISQETPLVDDLHVTTLHMEIETMHEEHYQKVEREMEKHGFVFKPYDAEKYFDLDLSKL